MKRQTTTSTRAQNIELNGMEAAKTVGNFGINVGAVAAGTLLGTLKAAAHGINQIKADEGSMMHTMANQGARDNLNMAQNATYDFLVTDSESVEKPSKKIL